MGRLIDGLVESASCGGVAKMDPMLRGVFFLVVFCWDSWLLLVRGLDGSCGCDNWCCAVGPFAWDDVSTGTGTASPGWSWGTADSEGNVVSAGNWEYGWSSGLELVG